MTISYRIFAGIGSRSTPEKILLEMSNISTLLTSPPYKWTLRSGGAKGADSAFESGVVEQRKQIFYAHHSTAEAEELAAKFHPAWWRCNDYARKLHGSNMIILLGPNLRDPVDCVICWTQKGADIGGTGQALRAAAHYGIPIFNLAIPNSRQLLRDFIS